MEKRWKKTKQSKKIKWKEPMSFTSFTISLRFVCLFFLLKEENNKKKWGLYILYSILQYFRGLLQDLDLGISSPSSDGKVREKIHRHPSRPPTFTKIHSNFNSQSGPPLSRGVAPKWDAKNKFKTAVCYVFKFCLFSEDGHQGKVMRETMEK
jgi:hypothetical protein